MNVKINVKMTTKVMYEFLLQHTYKNISGVAGVILGLGSLYLGIQALLNGDNQRSILFIFLGIMLLIVNPIMLRFKAAKQVKLTPMFKDPITYELNEEGIKISQHGAHLDLT